MLVTYQRLDLPSYTACCIVSHSRDITLNTPDGWWRLHVSEPMADVRQVLPDPLDTHFTAVDRDDFTTDSVTATQAAMEFVPDVIRMLVPNMILFNSA